jgi:glycerate-2-kinase
LPHIYVVGTGKAGASMAQAVEGILGERLTAGHVNVKYDHVLPTAVVRIHEAGHPIPDAAGVAGAGRIADLVAVAAPTIW